MKPVVHRATDATSIARYGKRAVSQSLLTQGAGYAEAIAARTVDRQKKPPIEMEQITIYLSAMRFPTTNTLYLLSQIELEKKVRVIYTPSGGLDPVTIDSQIQGETWTWLPGNDVTVTLNLAQS